jgi:proline iminopeptidase
VRRLIITPPRCAPRRFVEAGIRPARIRIIRTQAATLVRSTTMSARRIPISTPTGTFEVQTQVVGDSPTMKLLLLHGGPGATHEYFENLADHLPAAGIEIIYYDQLGSFGSDQPDDMSLWDLPRFVEEVEQVRQALGLDSSDFFLLGHSWGGILGIEYALKYGQHLKGLIVSNMMSSIPAYNRYAHDVLMPQMDQTALARILELEAAEDYDNPEYEALLMEHFYVFHVLRRPVEEWPECVVWSFEHINKQVYVHMQGPSEMGARGTLVEWDRFDDLSSITVPTLVIGAQHDTMDPEYLRAMAQRLPQGRYLHCPEGSHMAMHDDEETYVSGLVDFLRAQGG